MTVVRAPVLRRPSLGLILGTIRMDASFSWRLAWRRFWNPHLRQANVTIPVSEDFAAVNAAELQGYLQKAAAAQFDDLFGLFGAVPQPGTARWSPPSREFLAHRGVVVVQVRMEAVCPPMYRQVLRWARVA